MNTDVTEAGDKNVNNTVSLKHIRRIEESGYTIVTDAVELDLVEELNETLLRLETELNIVPGANSFEGHRTIRIYNLLARAAVFQKIPQHPALLPIVEGILDEGCLVSSLSSVSIDPGESAQPVHVDDTLMGLRRPHKPIVCNSMWALTDFTQANGATRLVPGSHRYDRRPEYGATYETIAAEMTRGSLLIWNGSLWHGGGANNTGERRVGIAMNYCAGFIRQQENQQLGIPLEVVKTFSPRLKALAGFGTYKQLIGHIDKQSPDKLLFNEGPDFTSIWDRVDR